MKHLKIFENISNKIYWIVVYNRYIDNETQLFLFDDEISAENCVITLVNEIRETQFSREDKEFLTSDMITDIDDAIEWLEDDAFDYKIFHTKIQNRGNFDPTDLKSAREIKKYNL